MPSLVTTRPDEARVDEANEVTVVMASTSSGALLDVRWRKSRGRPNLRGFDSCSSRGAVKRASAPGVRYFEVSISVPCSRGEGSTMSRQRDA